MEMALSGRGCTSLLFLSHPSVLILPIKTYTEYTCGVTLQFIKAPATHETQLSPHEVTSYKQDTALKQWSSQTQIYYNASFSSVHTSLSTNKTKISKGDERTDERCARKLSCIEGNLAKRRKDLTHVL